MPKKKSYPYPTIFKTIRNERELTQIAMAEILGITQAAYSHLETGNTFPSFKVIESTMRMFDVPFERFGEYNRIRARWLKTSHT